MLSTAGLHGNFCMVGVAVQNLPDTEAASTSEKKKRTLDRTVLGPSYLLRKGKR
jgi:hypothetical protein